MLRRKPSKIEVKVEDKEELEEARKRATAGPAPPTGAASILHHLNRNKDPSTKSQRIGLSS
uniref:Uncharacterized protein n=1 Tax=Nelumbo nucifera TaxID=4432 RepID=A0A822ZJN4_NELNU|nr:TPA_asm: hypothetical protein HUJ06_003297 [Nelumbo nucifera]